MLAVAFEKASWHLPAGWLKSGAVCDSRRHCQEVLLTSGAAHVFDNVISALPADIRETFLRKGPGPKLTDLEYRRKNHLEQRG